MTLLQTLIIIIIIIIVVIVIVITIIPYDPQWGIGPHGKTPLVGKKQDAREVHGGVTVIKI